MLTRGRFFILIGFQATVGSYYSNNKGIKIILNKVKILPETLQPISHMFLKVQCGMPTVKKKLLFGTFPTSLLQY